jgi:hypothetical protein
VISWFQIRFAFKCFLYRCIEEEHRKHVEALKAEHEAELKAAEAAAHAELKLAEATAAAQAELKVAEAAAPILAANVAGSAVSTEVGLCTLNQVDP